MLMMDGLLIVGLFMLSDWIFFAFCIGHFQTCLNECLYILIVILRSRTTYELILPTR